MPDIKPRSIPFIKITPQIIKQIESVKEQEIDSAMASLDIRSRALPVTVNTKTLTTTNQVVVKRDTNVRAPRGYKLG